MSACNCKADIEAKLLARFKEQVPEATAHDALLEGYALAVGKEAMYVHPYMPFKMQALFPLKKGGTKLKTNHSNMMFSFCPFCGQPLGDVPVDGAEKLMQLALGLVVRAKAFGMVVTIEQQPLQPLAMGNYSTTVAVRPQRPLADVAVKGGAA